MTNFIIADGPIVRHQWLFFFLVLVMIIELGLVLIQGL